jgi:hypothetical protein
MAEFAEYAEFLGVDTEYERDLFPIVKACIAEGVPKHWVFCQVNGTDDYFYFNKKSGESRWDHPLDDFYKQVVVEARGQRQCYVVSLALLEAGSKIQGPNWAGDVLVEQSATPDESFGDVEDRLRKAMAVDDDRVLCFALPDATLIGFSCRSKRVADVFKTD